MRKIEELSILEAVMNSYLLIEDSQYTKMNYIQFRE